MREIKFRAWYAKRKYMLSVHGISFADGEVYGLDGNDWNVDLGIEDVGLMQYTGLRDKNGVEIYEGDIVHDRHLNGGVNLEVKFGQYMTDDEHALAWYLESDDALELLSQAIDCEVIGNIYENPELLAKA